MELDNVIEQTIEPVVETVSTEPVVEVVEWKAPQTKEELDSILKANANRTYTKALKDLGVNSVKEFKELQTKLESERNEIEAIVKERDTYANSVKELEAKYQKISQESLLNELNIDEEYREDLVKLAKDRTSDTKTLEEVLKEMTEGKYKYAVRKESQTRMGIEKSQISDKDIKESEIKRLRQL